MLMLIMFCYFPFDGDVVYNHIIHLTYAYTHIICIRSNKQSVILEPSSFHFASTRQPLHGKRERK